jgi:Flp pilus assembly protein TadB
MPRRTRYAGQEWAVRDVHWISAFLALLVAGRLVSIVFLYVAIVLAAAVLTAWGVRAALRAHRHRTTEPPPFWADEIDRD